MKAQGYALIDSGLGRKLERFGDYIIDRPCAQAIWKPTLPKASWQKAHAIFKRLTEKSGKWVYHKPLPENWSIDVAHFRMKISPTPFGHLGIFPEQVESWQWLGKRVSEIKTEQARVLNLFAYSGGSTLACAKSGAQTCHLDASRPMVSWDKENAQLSSLKDESVIWMIDDVGKFLQREIRRGRQYEGVILDPPSFGRGPKKEIFKIENELVNMLRNCRKLLSANADFVLLSCHTPGITALVLRHMLGQALEGLGGTFQAGEMTCKGEKGVLELPSGVYCRWQKN
ncbi:MAG: class I SAM-dependent methyltransferase [Planctomycetes bacterium]|nr:class I SAM-dependent methyltransferase [Planctomycetota bacterium]